MTASEYQSRSNSRGSLIRRALLQRGLSLLQISSRREHPRKEGNCCFLAATAFYAAAELLSTIVNLQTLGRMPRKGPPVPATLAESRSASMAITASRIEGQIYPAVNQFLQHPLVDCSAVVLTGYLLNYCLEVF